MTQENFELYRGPYNADESEKKILAYWLAHDFYKPEYNKVTKKADTVEEMRQYLAENPDKKFTIIDPPPNAYDRPHIGNISGYAYQDLLGRFWRMNDKRVLLFPGKDHAGIQGEVVVLNDLFKPQGKNKNNITREEFYEQTYQYFTEMMARAQKDEQRIGLSADYARDTFTLDPKIVHNVLQTFIDLYDTGKVYKGVRIVNWCPSCQTALADIDTQKKERESAMYYIKYPIKGESDKFITIATTRPETMLGDTAVVVHPNDERYTEFHGKTAILPLMDREIPIILDPIIERETGTGALKLTPAHATEDYEIMIRWNQANPDKKVENISVIHKDAKIVGPAGKYVGVTVGEAREAVIADLKALGLLEKEEKTLQRVPVCERCKSIIQPIMSSQWFIKTDEMKKDGLDAVENGHVSIHPKYMTKKYLHWMKNLRDWPISRSLWWGYRFPIWYKGEVEETIDENGQITEQINGIEISDFADAVAKDLAKVSFESPGTEWKQDENVFDTWFSSGQWPYVTLQKEEIDDIFYPTNVMETGYDILEFWVSRMIMLGKFRTGKYPFTDVYLHGLVKAGDGQKMSKSKKNTVSLDELVTNYGADGLRLLYIVGNKAGASYRLDEEKLKGYRNFLNKLWNASKFSMMNLPSDVAEWTDNFAFTEDDKAMLEKLNALIPQVAEKIQKFRFGIVSLDLYDSFWHDFCDVYLEAIKQRLYTKDREGNPINTSDEAVASRKAAQWTLWKALDTYLRLLHPYIPFITEYIWQSFPKKSGESETIMYATWPTAVTVK
ncbi:MAG: valine--tRNA ligase [Candidatus Dojkabacteria bacterium]|nr:MAG: valine--tRNA ligase [Candidatus Dojkabacteria bacterium]